MKKGMPVSAGFLMGATLLWFGSHAAQHAFADDLQTLIQAIESTAPSPASQAPPTGTFFSAQFGDQWPPLPFDPLDLSFWSLGDGYYLYDDRNVDYSALQTDGEDDSGGGLANGRFAMMSSSMNSSYAYGNAVYLSNLVVSFASSNSLSAAFSIAGGTNFVPYDILMSTNVALPVSSWTWIGIGYTSNRYTFSNQPLSQGFYILAKPSKTMVAGWGDDTYQECDVWFGVTNAVQVAGGSKHSLALLNDGTVRAWGNNIYGQITVPASVTGATMVAAGWYHSLALLSNGTVKAWGLNGALLGYHLTEVPSDLTNATVISAQALHSLALRSNGTVVAWGYNPNGETNVPSGLSNVVAIAAGYEFNVAAKADGTVAAWGRNSYGQTNVPAGLSDVVDVAAGLYHALALKADGTVVAWGDGSNGATNVPPGLSNVVAIAAGGLTDDDSAYCLALKSDGTVVKWGESVVLDSVAGLSNVFAIGGGAAHALAIHTGPRTPVLTLEPSDRYQVVGGSVTFDAKGTGLYGVTYQWQSNGVNIAGATSNTLTLTNVQAVQATAYDVVITDNAGMGSIASSNAGLYVVTIPAITSQTLPPSQSVAYQSSVTLSAGATAPGEFDGFPLSYQWQLNGTNLSGATGSSYSFSAVYAGSYSVVVTNAAGSTNVAWFLHPVMPGGVWGWGEDDQGQSDSRFGLTNIMAIAAGTLHTLAVGDDGLVRAWGDDYSGQINVPTGLSNVVAVACGSDHSLALRADGTVVGWGDDTFGQTEIPPSLTNATAIAAAWSHNIALLKNGLVATWGDDVGATPATLTNAMAVACGGDFDLAVRSNGTVVAWGGNDYEQTNVPAGLSNVVAISAGDGHALALKSDGTVVAWGNNWAGQTNVPLDLTNAMAIAAGSLFSMALRNDGTVVAWGDNSLGQTTVPAGVSQIKSIAAGGDHALALWFSPLVQYQVDVTKDLLLVYNTNSVDSIFVKDYYLAHRPMVSGANVVGIGFTGFYISNFVGNSDWVGVTNITDYETISPPDFTSQILNPVLGWLGSNPTKRPQYVVLLLDVPSRVNIGATNAANFPFYNSYGAQPSVSFQLSNNVPRWQTFITHINMNGTNACVGYIDKLASIGASYSPGKLLISAGGGGYSNTNYFFDDSRKEIFPGPPSRGSQAAAAVLAVDPTASVTYSNGVDVPGPDLTNHITVGSNVAGYLCFGGHSNLQQYYAINGNVKWSGKSGWWLIETIESFDGQRYVASQGNYISWFASNAFGGTNYFNTPVGAVSYVDEPSGAGVNDPALYFGSWTRGKNFAMCAWIARQTTYFQAVGDPFVTK